MLLRPATLLTTAAALAGAAYGIVQRDLATIQGALNNINTLLQQIDLSITSLTPQNVMTVGPQLLQVSQTILPSLQGVQSQLESSAQLTLDESNQLNAAREAIRQNINTTANDLIQQKPLFDMAGLSAGVADSVQQVRDFSNTFLDTLATKLAPDAPGLADQKQFAFDLFTMVIQLFRGQQVTGAGAAAPNAPVVPPTTGLGTLNPDGSCNCAVSCPANSLVLNPV